MGMQQPTFGVENRPLVVTMMTIRLTGWYTILGYPKRKHYYCTDVRQEGRSCRGNVDRGREQQQAGAQEKAETKYMEISLAGVLLILPIGDKAPLSRQKHGSHDKWPSGRERFVSHERSRGGTSRYRKKIKRNRHNTPKGARRIAHHMRLEAEHTRDR